MEEKLVPPGDESTNASESLANVQGADRIIMRAEQSKRVTAWVTELNRMAGGLIHYSKSDVVNFLIASHARVFSPTEASAIANECFDEERWLSWSLAKVKAAKKNGVPFSFDKLQNFRDELLGGTRPSKAKNKSKPVEPLPAEPDSHLASPEVALERTGV